MEHITVATAIIAIVRQIKDSFPSIKGIVTMVIAMILGAVAGYFHIQEIPNVANGILLGIAAVGTVTVAEKIAGE